MSSGQMSPGKCLPGKCLPGKCHRTGLGYALIDEKAVNYVDRQYTPHDNIALSLGKIKPIGENNTNGRLLCQFLD
jgi:hypothetical protein